MVIRELGFEVLKVLLVLFEHPTLAAELFLVAGILGFSVGRSLGLPLMFWSDRNAIQFVAGLASTLLTAQVFFVAYLASSIGAPRAYFWTALVIWGAVVVFAVVAQLLRWLAARGAVATILPWQSPRIRELENGKLSRLVSPAAAPWPFAAGVLLVAAIVFGVRRLDWCLVALGPPTAEWPVWARAPFDVYVWLDRVLSPVTGPHDLAHLDLHVLATIGFAVAALAAVVLVWLPAAAPPAVSVCALLAIVAAVDAFLSFWLRSPGPEALLAAFLLWGAGTQRYKVRLGELRDEYRVAERRGATCRPYPPKSSDRVGGPRDAAFLNAAPEAALRADLFCEYVEDGALPVSGGEGGRPIVVVCTSGGGIRAAVWTAALLARFEKELPDFRSITWMITGASGGMVGAAAWVASLRAEGAISWGDLVDAVASDGLSPVAQALALGDAPRTVLPFFNPWDRGTQLQRAWANNLRRWRRRGEPRTPAPVRTKHAPMDLDVALASLRDDEAAARFPSLVFSPMVVEDGRRMLFTNLSLAPAVTNELDWLDANGRVGKGVASVSAYHARAVLGEEAFAKVTLATAARLSASFPYVSPAAQLPTVPPVRLVDAGYYDNYGVELACSWLQRGLERNAPWIADNVSGVLVLQIRDSESSLSAGGDQPANAPPPELAKTTAFERAGYGLTSPPRAVLSARESAMMFRNDAQFHAVAQHYEQTFGHKLLATSIFELKGDVSLSWALSEGEIALIRGQAGAHAIGAKVDAIRKWLTNPNAPSVG